MAHYSVQPRDKIFVKDYRFLRFAKNMRKNFCENISKSLSSKKPTVRIFLIMLNTPQ